MNQYTNERGELLRVDMAVLIYWHEHPTREKPLVYRLIRFYQFGGDCNGDRTWVVLESHSGRIVREPARLVHPFSLNWFRAIDPQMKPGLVKLETKEQELVLGNQARTKHRHRSESIRIRCSPEHKTTLENASADAGTTLSSWLVYLGLREAELIRKGIKS